LHPSKSDLLCIDIKCGGKLTLIFAELALLESGWAENVRFELSRGKINSITTGGKPVAGDTRVDTLLPALSNLHSHTFQRAMAGMTEFRAEGRDSFWTWRDLMYRFVNRITPEQLQAIAAMVFVEMQEAGFAAVGEFHYVHHQKGGTPYADVAELSNRIFSAAEATGMGLTLLPVLYTYGGAGQVPLGEGQLRFGNSVDQFVALTDAARKGLAHLSADARMGVAPHSLRATSPADLTRLLLVHKDCPIHIHAAEQPKEVEDVKTWLGASPVEWLLANAGVDHNWCLIHATHMTEAETSGLAKSGAVAGLCPITEANLGDGPFNGPGYLAHAGAFGIGSDSNVNISLTEELRMLEYSQRLRDVARNVLVAKGGSVGQTLYCGAAHGGARALNRNSGRIAMGRLADLVAIDRSAPALCALAPHQILDGLVFAAKDNVVTDVWSAGRHNVQGGHHFAREKVVGDYRKAVGLLLTAD
jgi:formimidoylglutamate deiminase